jgi:hypothetical protein
MKAVLSLLKSLLWRRKESFLPKNCGDHENHSNPEAEAYLMLATENGFKTLDRETPHSNPNVNKQGSDHSSRTLLEMQLEAESAAHWATATRSARRSAYPSFDVETQPAVFRDWSQAA